MTVDERIYQIACSFPVLRKKGLEDGDIPGLTPKGFYDQKLAAFVYNGSHGALSSGEILVLEFLLNLFDPHIYPSFNLGRAVQVWDIAHLQAFLNAVIRTVNGQ